MNYSGVELEAFEESWLVGWSLVTAFPRIPVEALVDDDGNLDSKNYYPNLKDMVGEALPRNALNALNSVEVWQSLMGYHLEFRDNLLELKIESFQHLQHDYYFDLLQDVVDVNVDVMFVVVVDVDVDDGENVVKVVEDSEVKRRQKKIVKNVVDDNDNYFVVDVDVNVDDEDDDC